MKHKIDKMQNRKDKKQSQDMIKNKIKVYTNETKDKTEI